MNAEDFNNLYKVGHPVILINDFGDEVQTKTTSEAWELGHGESVVKVEGIRGGYSLSRIKPMEVHN